MIILFSLKTWNVFPSRRLDISPIIMYHQAARVRPHHHDFIMIISSSSLFRLALAPRNKTQIDQSTFTFPDGKKSGESQQPSDFFSPPLHSF